MNTQERHKIIMQEINRKNSITVIEIAELIQTSESTIRRDLLELDRQGKLHRVHGGASAIHRLNTSVEDDVDTRFVAHIEAKDDIARYAADLIEENDFVFIDAGTTTLRMLEHLSQKDAIYVTNGLLQAQFLIKKGYKVQILGGEIRNLTGAIVGSRAITSLSQLNFTKGFFGTNGADYEFGFTTPDTEEAAIKEIALHHCLMAYVLCDDSKFNKVTPIRFGDIEDAIIVTNRCDEMSIKDHTTVVEVSK